MKTFKRIQAMVLATIMSVMTLGTTTAFAAEDTMNNTREDIPVVSESNAGIVPLDSLRFMDSVTISTTHSESGRNFVAGSNNLRFDASFTTGGNPIVAIRLHDVSAGGVVIREWQSSNGKIQDTVGVTRGRTYVFEYLVAYGSRSVQVSNVIFDA